MNSEKQPIKDAIKTYYAAKALSDKQFQSLQTLQDKAKQQTSNKTSMLKWAGSIAASFLLFIIVLVYMQTPKLITAAYADIKIDASTNNGMPTSMRQWLHEKNIDAVPQQYEVEMSKFCQLDDYKTTHLRIAGTRQGTLHLFFHYGERPFYWLNRSGTKNEINWKVIKVRNDLTLVVMHTLDMREESVKHILGAILPELQA